MAPLIRSDADDTDSFQSGERGSTNAHDVRHWLWIDADITVPTILANYHMDVYHVKFDFDIRLFLHYMQFSRAKKLHFTFYWGKFKYHINVKLDVFPQFPGQMVAYCYSCQTRFGRE